MKKFCITLISLFFFFICELKSAEPYYFFSPGVKLGYQFGENGGTVFGLELSVMRTVDYFPNVGIVANIDFCKGNTKLHLGAQTAHIIGLDIGPTVYFTENKTNFGYTVGIYGLLYIMPFYEYTQIYDDQNFSIYQSGVFLKAPIPSREYILRLVH